MSEPKQGGFIFGDRTYDVVKRMVQVILPAFSALYFGLASIWDLPEADKVVGTIAVITTFLGVSLGISSAQYAARNIGYDGKLVVRSPRAQGEGPTIYSLEIDKHPDELVHKKSISFKVEKNTSPLESEIL